MSKRIKVADLPEFDAAHYLDSETFCRVNYRQLQRDVKVSSCRGWLWKSI
jgi:hypothetical protein